MNDNFVQMRYSKDGGRTWSNWKIRSLGELGAYKQRVRFEQLGDFYELLFDIRISSPVPRNLIAAAIAMEGSNE